MTRILKYVINDAYINHTFLLPKGRNFLSIQIVAGNIAIYMMVDEAEKKVQRTFRIASTGETLEENENYIGTIQCSENILHLMEIL